VLCQVSKKGAEKVKTKVFTSGWRKYGCLGTGSGDNKPVLTAVLLPDGCDDPLDVSSGH